VIRELLDSRSVWRRLIYPIRPHMGLMSLVVIFEILRQVSGIGVAVLGAALFAWPEGPLVIWALIYLMWRHSASRSA